MIKGAFEKSRRLGIICAITGELQINRDDKVDLNWLVNCRNRRKTPETYEPHKINIKGVSDLQLTPNIFQSNATNNVRYGCTDVN